MYNVEFHLAIKHKVHLSIVLAKCCLKKVIRIYHLSNMDIFTKYNGISISY